MCVSNLKHVVLCGGAGTRLWPLSHAKAPKQLLQLFGNRSLLQESVLRNSNYCKELLVVCNTHIVADVRGQIGELKDLMSVKWIEEPEGRNTAAAIALSALMSAPDDLLLVTPSDHLILNDELYAQTVASAAKFATEGYLVTIGLRPAYPETGYGYIQYQGNEVLAFTEKPDKENAIRFMESGNYLWNSGIFCFSVRTILEEMELHAKDILLKCREAVTELKETGSISIKSMKAIPSLSIDYAVMERSRRIKVVPSDIKWSDVGTYDALIEAIADRDEHSAINIACESAHNYVFHQKRPVAIVGLENIIVVDHPNGLLVMKKGMGQHVKEVYNEVAARFPESI